MTEPINMLQEKLATTVARDQHSHAYIFSGADAFDQAQLLAMALNCQSLKEGQPCMVCPACHKMQAGSHPDLTIIEPDNGTLKIEQFRKMQASAYLKAYEGRNKAFIIKDAETMQDASANSLLKILEEPPSQTVFILISSNPEALLPTILSRCQSYDCGGGVSLAIDEEAVEAQLKSAEIFLEGLPNMSCAQVLTASKVWEKNKEGLFNHLCALLRLTHETAKGKPITPYKEQDAWRAANMLEKSLGLLDRNINARLLVDVVYLRLWLWAGGK